MPDPQSALAADALFAIFVGFVGLAVTVEAALGFGSVLVTLTLGATLYPVSTVLPLAVCINVMLTSYIVARHHRRIAWDVLLKRILPAMGVGMVGGYTVFVSADETTLRTILGLFVVSVAALEIKRLVRPTVVSGYAISDRRFIATALAAGVIHGVMATGGPILIYAVNRLGLDKSTFRNTMCGVWLTLNTLLIVTYTGAGRIGTHNAGYIAALAPVVALAIAVGEWLHGRLDERTFRLMVLIMLLVAGVTLLA